MPISPKPGSTNKPPEALLPPDLRFSVSLNLQQRSVSKSLKKKSEALSIFICAEDRPLAQLTLEPLDTRYVVPECLVNLNRLRKKTGLYGMGLAVVLTSGVHYQWWGEGLGAALYAKAAQVAWDRWGAAICYNVCLRPEYAKTSPSTSPKALRVWGSRSFKLYVISAIDPSAPVAVWRGCLAE